MEATMKRAIAQGAIYLGMLVFANRGYCSSGRSYAHHDMHNYQFRW